MKDYYKNPYCAQILIAAGSTNQIISPVAELKNQIDSIAIQYIEIIKNSFSESTKNIIENTIKNFVWENRLNFDAPGRYRGLLIKYIRCRFRKQNSF